MKSQNAKLKSKNLMPFSTLVLDFCPIVTPQLSYYCPTTIFLLTLYLVKGMIKLYNKKGGDARGHTSYVTRNAGEVQPHR